MQNLKHGHRWQAANSDRRDSISETKIHFTESLIALETIVAHDISCLSKFLVAMPKEMHKLFLKGMYEVVTEATESTGNVVSGKDFKTGFMEALETVKFGVDRWGVPSAPELHVHPGFAKKIEQYAKESDPDYEAKIERITEMKKEAIADEARRVARYKLR